MSLEENILKVRERVRKAAEKSGRNENDVKIIAVTKYVDVNLTKKVMDLGLKDIGENRDKVAISKYEELGDKGTWHFIGNLQTRKVKNIVGKFDYIHSLDRLSLANEVNKRAEQNNILVPCFVQVNVSGEESKSGLKPDELSEFIQQIKDYKNIKIVGLMTMAPHVEDKEKTRPVFQQLRELRDHVNGKDILDYPITELSMGMSNDFEIAIEEGATFIRLGTVLFQES